ncbi:putative necrosis-inducing factor-domain-containing protein [Panaeolus papilionaceus]|nr:putative necrosis-inducing factor-domain-containing protein [Panaeolus papilionaceus]
MFKTIQLATLVAAIFAVAVSGSPVDVTPVEPLKAIKRASDNRRGDSDFVNQTSTWGVASVSDCRVIINNISGGGIWTTPPFSQQRELASFGQCEFGVQSVGSSPEFQLASLWRIRFIDLINNSINRFQSPDGRVGSKGTMKCGSTDVEWGLSMRALLRHVPIRDVATKFGVISISKCHRDVVGSSFILRFVYQLHVDLELFLCFDLGGAHHIFSRELMPLFGTRLNSVISHYDMDVQEIMFKIVQTLTLAAAFLAAANGTPVDVTPTEPWQAIKRASESRCGDSSFINQTSGASPKASDCRGITKNIAGGGTWTTPSFGQQRELVSFGECKFGVTSLNAAGGFNFVVGNQDIIDIINDSIKRFQSSAGRVGAKGTMNCGGTDVEWGLY